MTEPLVSCLCVTENRPAFLPWLLWSFQRQTWPHRELVIVSGSPVPEDIASTLGVRVIAVAPGTSVPAKRNVALDAAAGSILAWFDDDDWQHPQRLERLVCALTEDIGFAGWGSAWFVDLHRRRCERYPSAQQVLFNGAGFRASLARDVRFNEAVRRGSDSQWLRALRARSARWTLLDGDDGFFWLCHDANLSNPARRRRFPDDVLLVREAIGAAWLDTDHQLDALCRRIATTDAAPSNPGPPRVPARPKRATLVTPPCGPSGLRARDFPQGRPPSSGRAAVIRRSASVSLAPTVAADELPPVAAVVKITALDAPFIGATVPHMLRQARFAFRERILVVDRRRTFTGKYASRSGGTLDELDRVAASLLDAGTIDRIVDVDDDPAVSDTIMRRYFGADAPRVPTHAVSGGPIYPTLFGLEAASVDHVAQFDADMLFHAGTQSWVALGLQALHGDPSIWFAMTHGGPPSGPPGAPHSLGVVNARRARWEPERQLWHYRTVSTRYFLTDRRRLHGRIRAVPMKGGVAPLEVCLSRAMQHAEATRVGVAVEDSWDLHPWSHASPFPQWAPRIAAAVERGEVPARQRGQYDLRLDRPADRRAWRTLLDGEERPTSTLVASPAEAAARTRSSGGPRAAPLAVVIPIRDRAGDRLRRCLHALQWQSTGPPLQVVIVSQGSQPHIDRELATMCTRIGARLIAIGSPDDPWRKPLALNVGLRATDPALRFVMTLDADMILAPGFLAVVLDTLREDPNRLVLCRASDLDARTSLPLPERLRDAYPQLAARARLRGHHGTGGIQAAPRSFFFDVRGYDEDLVWWGAEDGDMVRRAELSGLTRVWICDRTSMLHQWHPKTHTALDDPARRAEAAAAWRRNHRLVAQRADQPTRNDERWGRNDDQASAPRIVIGLGTGRCGSSSLTALLDAQPGCSITHESRPVLRWQETERAIDDKLADLVARRARIVGDVCHTWLPHIERVLERFESAVAICLSRDRTATVESLLRKTEGRDHWSASRPPGRRASYWDPRFPTYDLCDKRAAIARYWDEYDAAAAELQARFPERFRVFSTDALNSESGVAELLAFAGVEGGEILVGLHRNRGRRSRSTLETRSSVPPPRAPTVGRRVGTAITTARTVLRPTRPGASDSGSGLASALDDLRSLRERYCAEVSSDRQALSLAAIGCVAETIRAHAVQRVLDLGSGFGSAALRQLRRSGCLPSVEEILSVDDSPQWLTATRSFCRAEDLGEDGFLDWADGVPEHAYDFVLYDLGHMDTRADRAGAIVDLVRRPGFVYYDDLHKPGFAHVVDQTTRDRGVVFIDVVDRTLDRFGRFGMLARLDALPPLSP